MDENTMSKVYVKADTQGRILRCEGGYTMSNIDDVSEWIFIDEGTGDKYNLCQTHYFDGGLYTDDGICRYVYEDETCRLRTEEEIQADRDERDAPKPIHATRTYDVGEYIVIDGVMYKVLLPILAWSQITVGTNVEETTIEAEMANFNKEEL